jgi:hypothetical protein
MLVNKYLALGDFNEHNLMIGSSGEVLRVDMGYVPSERTTGVTYSGPCMPMNQRGFQTSQQFTRKIILKQICRYVTESPFDVAAFIERLILVAAEVRGEGVSSRWFDDSTLRSALSRGENDAINNFCADVYYYPKK